MEQSVDLTRTVNTLLKNKPLIFREDSCAICQETLSGVGTAKSGGLQFQTLLQKEAR